MGSSFNPLAAPTYVAGTITISGAQINVVQNLLSLIQTQLEPNCPGTAIHLRMTADTGNSASVRIGQSSQKGGALTDTNYGVTMAANVIVAYDSAIEQSTVPLGALRVFCTATATIHLELY